MLHNRRKAEIEIISSSSSSPRLTTDVSSSIPPSQSGAGSVPSIHSQASGSNSNSVATPNSPLLLRYLATKISACVLSAAALDNQDS